MLQNTLEGFRGNFLNIFECRGKKDFLYGHVLWFCVSWEQVFTGVPRLKFHFSKVSYEPWSFVLDPRDSSLFLLGVSLALRLAHGNTWISPRRDIKDGYSCIICIIVSMTKSTEFIHSQDVFFWCPHVEKLKRYFTEVRLNYRIRFIQRTNFLFD